MGFTQILLRLSFSWLVVTNKISFNTFGIDTKRKENIIVNIVSIQ